MKIFKKLFGETEMTWKLLLVYSIVTGVVVGLLNCVPMLENTSFVYPAVNLEYWFVAAIFVIVNCKSAKEATLKTFLFFLISQPLIYLVEVPFKEMGWELFGYYKYWAFVTVLTIPGSFIAYQIKKDNILSPVILSVATGFLFTMGIRCAQNLLTSFPYGLVATIFCLMFGVILIQVIMQSKKNKIVAYACSIALAAALLFITRSGDNYIGTGIELDGSHQWEIVEADTTSSIDGQFLNVSTTRKGIYYVTIKNENGEIVKYVAVFTDNETSINEVKE